MQELAIFQCAAGHVHILVGSDQIVLQDADTFYAFIEACMGVAAMIYWNRTPPEHPNCKCDICSVDTPIPHTFLKAFGEQ